MCRSSVLLPQPLPPMMKKMLPRFTVKSRSRITTKSPNAIVRWCTVIRSSAGVSAISDPERVAQDGEHAVGDDDPHDAQHDRRRRGLSHGRGVAARAYPLHAAGDRDDDAEDDALGDAQPEIGERDRTLPLEPELRRGE